VVDVDAHVAHVDRGEVALVVDRVLLHRCVGGVRLEDALVDRARREGVVDPVDDVAKGSVLGQDQLVDQGAAVTGGAGLEREAGVRLERGDELVGQGERVVRHQDDGAGVGRGAGRVPAGAVAADR